ncbi:MAG: NAD regulator [Hyphomicrobiaceae bacterium]
MPDAHAAHVVRPTTETIPAAVEIGLSAAIITVRNDEPAVLTVRGTPDPRMPKDVRLPNPSLPFGPFTPRDHRTLDTGLRSWVKEQTGLSLNYVEQLYTFADRGRHDASGSHVVSIGYVALVQPSEAEEESATTSWRSWYDFFPWEDWRSGKPEILTDTIEPLLLEWASRPQGDKGASRTASRMDRLHIAFGMDGGNWDEEKVLERFEMLYEAGLIDEASRDDREAAEQWTMRPPLGQPLCYDHRRILATSIGRIRAKIKYRPVVFEVMPSEFTLFELQKTVEAILGPHLHKQNFRRLVESAGLVETTGEVRVKTGGRPARLYQFREKVLLERPAPGVRVNISRN